jgi:hypothetical protein
MKMRVHIGSARTIAVSLLALIFLAFPAANTLAERGAAVPGAPVTDSEKLQFLYEQNGAFYYETFDGRIAVAEREGGIISGVPDYEWWYGCSPTSAGMMMGYYDREGYLGMVSGGAELESFIGPAPNANAAIASAGHINAFWDGYGVANDPNPASHPTNDSLADFMGTNKWQLCGNVGGSTSWWYWNDGHPWTPADSAAYSVDGCEGIWGVDAYVNWRGFDRENVTNQRPETPDIWPSGMTLTEFQAEIDADRPVIIHVEGHSMTGYGYVGATMYVSDTWDPKPHTMTWGGQYDGRNHRGVSTLTVTGWKEAYAGLQLTEEDVDLLRRYRDEVLVKNTEGNLYQRLAYADSEKALAILEANPELQQRAGNILAQSLPDVEAVLAGGTGVVHAAPVVSFLNDYADEATLRHKLMAAVVKYRLLRAQRTGDTFLGFEVH